MIKNILSVGFLFLIGCGTADPLDYIAPKFDPEVASELKPDYDYFMQTCKDFGKNELCKKNKQKLRTVKIVDSLPDSKSGGKVAGLCTVYGTGVRKVEILKDIAKPNSYTHKGLVFHELAHCLLDYGHAPESSQRIMAPALLWEEVYKLNWSSLVEDLFKNPIQWNASLSLTEGPLDDMIWEIHTDGSEHFRKTRSTR